MAFQEEENGGRETNTGGRGLEIAPDTPITGTDPNIDFVNIVL